jgi:hypothetical protein
MTVRSQRRMQVITAASRRKTMKDECAISAIFASIDDRL